MNDSLIQDSLKAARELLTHMKVTRNFIDYWMLIAIAEFAVILFLIAKIKINGAETSKMKFKKESLKQNIDFDNIINSSFNSLSLYNELKIKCHPDKFSTDKEKNLIAEEIFQEIAVNKTNVNRLLELKEEAIQKLNIHF